MDRRQFIKTTMAAVAATVVPVEEPKYVAHSTVTGRITGPESPMLNRDLEPIGILSAAEAAWMAKYRKHFDEAFRQAERGIYQVGE